VTAAQVQEAVDEVQGAEHEDDFIQVLRPAHSHGCNERRARLLSCSLLSQP